MKCFLIFICSLVSITTFGQRLLLTGSVKDKSGQILPGTGIYVSGYKIATVADNNGNYVLLLKPGNYDVLFQLIGYKALNKNMVIADQPVQLDVILQESITQLAEVTIKPDPDRAHYIAMFKDFFVGTTPNAIECKIVNPDVLLIDYEKTEGKLTVKTTDFLVIENQALGYRIKYLINHFEWSSKTRIVYYEGFPHYEDLKGSERKKRIWAKKRLLAYSGSPQHFFKSLYNGTVSKQGFIIHKLITQPNTERPDDSLINENVKRLTKKQMMTTGKILIGGADDSLSYWLAKKKLNKDISILNRAVVKEDTLVKTFNENIKAVNFTDQLYIIYTKEQEDQSFQNRISQSLSRPLDLSNYQISLVALQIAPVYFYANGGIYNPRSMLFSGYWAWEKTADSVPMDYLPPSTR